MTFETESIERLIAMHTKEYVGTGILPKAHDLNTLGIEEPKDPETVWWVPPQLATRMIAEPSWLTAFDMPARGAFPTKQDAEQLNVSYTVSIALCDARTVAKQTGYKTLAILNGDLNLLRLYRL